MSERKLWQMAERLAEEYVDETGNVNPARVAWECAEEAREALAEPPDVVVLLRWLRKEHGANPLKEQGRESTSSKVLWAIITELQKTVRLTADGWKWVEEGENEVGQ